MSIEEKREVGYKSNRINSLHPADQANSRKTTSISGEASRGGSRLVKSGLLSPNRSSNPPSLAPPRGGQSGEAGRWGRLGAGQWAIRAL